MNELEINMHHLPKAMQYRQAPCTNSDEILCCCGISIGPLY